MRSAFIDSLYQIASHDPNVMLVSGDLGFGVLDRFVQDLPDQFVNVGVAEQSMTGVAAGLALTGRVVFTYSIGNFSTIRCLEQIRNDVCYHNARVHVVAVGGGFAYGALGFSHHATEDLAITRALPGLTVVAPGDPHEARSATQALAALDGPSYLRLGRDGEASVHEQGIDFSLGRAIKVRPGNDGTLIVTGSLLPVAVAAADRLKNDDIAIRVLSMHTIKPLDNDAVAAAASETGAIFTLEEHSEIGGLGGAVAEAIYECPVQPRVFRRLALPDAFDRRVGSQEFLRKRYGLDAESIANEVRKSLEHAVRTG